MPDYFPRFTKAPSHPNPTSFPTSVSLSIPIPAMTFSIQLYSPISSGLTGAKTNKLSRNETLILFNLCYRLPKQLIRLVISVFVARFKPFASSNLQSQVSKALLVLKESMYISVQEAQFVTCCFCHLIFSMSGRSILWLINGIELN